MSTQIEENIQNEDEYKEVKKDLTQKKKPSKILRMLMNSMENYRQKKKYGWSRSWNKYDLVNFQVFKLDWQNDTYLLEYVKSILEQQFSDTPSTAIDFCNDLLDDKSNLMGFIFVHDYDDNGIKYEGVNLSLGRVSNKKYRDRLDIILESPVENNESKGLGRVRLYIDPYNANIKEPIHKAVSIEPNKSSEKLFSILSNLSWENDTDKLWNHWTVNYINYFGEREWDLKSSYFLSNNTSNRLLISN